MAQHRKTEEKGGSPWQTEQNCDKPSCTTNITEKGKEQETKISMVSGFFTDSSLAPQLLQRAI